MLICLSLLAISCAYPHSNSPININIHDTGVCVCVCVCVLNHTTSTPTATLCALHYHQKTAGLSVPSTLLRPRSNDFPKTMTLYWVLYLWGTVVLFMSLEEKEGGEKPQTKEKQEKGGWIFHRFYYFSGKAPRKSDKHRPQLENRKAVWQADKAWGSDTPHPMYKTTQQTHYHLYETTGSQEGAGAVTQCIHIKKKWW